MSDLETRLAAVEHRVGELEDVNAIRRLHWAYGYYIDFNRAEDVVQLFAADGAVVGADRAAMMVQTAVACGTPSGSRFGRIGPSRS